MKFWAAKEDTSIIIKHNMKINWMAEQGNDHLDEHVMIPTGARPAKGGVMWLVGAAPSSHDHPPRGSLSPLAGRVISVCCGGWGALQSPQRGRPRLLGQWHCSEWKVPPSAGRLITGLPKCESLQAGLGDTPPNPRAWSSCTEPLVYYKSQAFSWAADIWWVLIC